MEWIDRWYRFPCFAVVRRLAVLLAVCWVVVFCGPLSFVMLIVLPFALWHAVRARSVPAMVFVLLANPLSFFFGYGVVDYVRGRPALLGMGLPGAEYANIDPETRCLRRSGGCVIHGNEWVFLLPHNAALRMLTAVLGPPWDTYDGPYPTRGQALDAVKARGVAVSGEQFFAGVIPTDAGEVVMPRDVAEKIGTHLFAMSGYGWGEQVEGERLYATLWEGRCLVLHWTREEDDGRDEVLVLVDNRNARPFAVYAIELKWFIRRAAIDLFWR